MISNRARFLTSVSGLSDIYHPPASGPGNTAAVPSFFFQFFRNNGLIVTSKVREGKWPDATQAGEWRTKASHSYTFREDWREIRNNKI
ncbi:hypothetical protein Y032_0053g2359 [Ancylostoma ceylanicum]|uniref:Uncharacterized protein n=1 Tax=Ancylostoma ceylanicum TaxID=53326 RepID=A0A016U7I6_9BILA|nr:hypothetical protein Y032_0053g2359 [Ancylostoma ceylanicum]